MKTATNMPGTLHYCKACKKKTRHGPVIERTDERDCISRCHECGQRPDRPLDGHERKVVCPQCQKNTTATYHDDDGIDTWSLDCDCGLLMGHDELEESQTAQHQRDRNDAQIMATAIWNANKGNKRLQRIAITIGSYTAVVDRKE